LDGSAQWAVVTVQDSGIGIPAEELPHLFEQFFRASNVSGRIAGTGIGLATARQVVELHAGRIEVESDEARGSIFSIRLPLGDGDDGPSDDDKQAARDETLHEVSAPPALPAPLAWEPRTA